MGAYAGRGRRSLAIDEAFVLSSSQAGGEEVSDESATAVSLMRMALALLDRSGDLQGAARLQHAIDTVLRSPLGPPSREQIEDQR